MTDSIPAEHFRALYARDPDPWRFATSEYERDKYAATVAALGERRFRAGFEVGCSIGVLTRQLAARCDAMLGVDVAEPPLRAARARCADVPGARFARMSVPGEWPDGSLDLVVFSEVIYYLGAADRRLAAERTLGSLSPGGVVLMVCWHGPTDGTATGDEAAEHFIGLLAPRLRPVRQDRAALYRLDLLA